MTITYLVLVIFVNVLMTDNKCTELCFITALQREVVLLFYLHRNDC